MNAKQRMYARIEKHGNDLKAVFNLPDADPINLCKKLHTIELKNNNLMVQYCNGLITDAEVVTATEKLFMSLSRIIGIENMSKIYINRDPRGYTLKLSEEATKQAQDAGINIHRDWGGYGILAPEFDGNE